jgi:hypothetical protein
MTDWLNRVRDLEPARGETTRAKVTPVAALEADGFADPPDTTAFDNVDYSTEPDGPPAEWLSDEAQTTPVELEEDK